MRPDSYREWVYLSSGLAEIYARTGRIKDAVSEAQEILKRDPQNLEAHRLLGHIYLRSLGEIQSGSGSDSVLKLAIDQYEQILKLDPSSVDDHIMLGRLYHADNQLKKAEEEEKIAVKLAPDSEEAVSALAMLYNEEGDATKAAETLASVPEATRSAKLYAVLGETYDQQLGQAARKKIGNKHWNRRVARAIDAVRTLTNFDTLYVGGGNARHLALDLHADVRVISNEYGMRGGAKLWADEFKA
jgi:tetratricopeptide (TPR) repeat protein